MRRAGRVIFGLGEEVSWENIVLGERGMVCGSVAYHVCGGTGFRNRIVQE